MGFLDDAIREHLDLKRRRGADPTEIEQAEREALGPVRRSAFEAADEPESSVAERLPAYDQATESEYEEYEAPAENGQEWGDAFEDDDQLPAEPDRVPAVAEETYEEPVAPVPAEPHAAEPVTPEAPETAEYDVERALADEQAEVVPPEAPMHDEPQPTDPPAPEREPGAPEEEDVLEETPEFLQDTPDHDRLWFEQRPPRDFDFDG